MAVLGFDIDGVITAEGKGEENIWYRHLKRFMGDKLKKVKASFNFAEAYNIAPSKLEEFFAENLVKIYSQVPPLPEAKKYLNKYKAQGNKIILITARDKKFRELTAKWLNKNEIAYDILYHDENKAPLAARENIKVFVDDNYNNAREIMSKNIPVLLYTRHHNVDAPEEYYFRRVNNWQEIDEIIANKFLS